MNADEKQAIVDLLDELVHACEGSPHNLPALAEGPLGDVEIADCVRRLDRALGGLLNAYDDVGMRLTNAKGTVRMLASDLEDLRKRLNKQDDERPFDDPF